MPEKSMDEVFFQEDSVDEKVLDNLEDNIGPIIHLINDELLLKVYSAVLEKEEEWINNNITLSQEIALLTAIFKTNDVEELIGNFTQALNLMNLIIKTKSQSQK